MSNPLIDRAPYPAYDVIRPEHFMPALEEIFVQIREKLAALKSDTSAPTFENTVVPLHELFAPASFICETIEAYGGHAYTDEIAEIGEQIDVAVADFEKSVYQDLAIGGRLRTVYDARTTLTLDEDDEAVLRNVHRAFERAGAFFDINDPHREEKFRRLRAIDEELIGLAKQFTDNTMKGAQQQAVHVTDIAELSGCTESDIASFAENAQKNGKEGWLVIPERLHVDEVLERADSPSFRRNILEALDRIGRVEPYDNRPVIAAMQKAYQAYAEVLGYPHYAAIARQGAMQSDLRATYALLDEVGKAAFAKFEEDMASVQEFARRNGGPDRLERWDTSYWAQRQKKALYDISGFEEYLPHEGVMNGLFQDAGRLMGLTFMENTAYPKLHDDMRTYDVVNSETGAPVAMLHVDLFARDGVKGSGAWAASLQSAAPGFLPAAIMALNLAKPAAGRQTLLSVEQYTTVYHEAGHDLHVMRGTNVKHASLQGFTAATDFSEIPSTLNELRALLKKNLLAYARHVDTGAPPPEALVDRVIAAQKHFTARGTLRHIQNARRDLAFFTMDPAQYEEAAFERTHRLPGVYADHLNIYPLTRFGHMFSDAHSNYAAGYVDYLPARVFAEDGIEPFETDPYNPEQIAPLRLFYNRGAGGNLLHRYEAYRGRPATTDAYFRAHGFAPPAPGV